MNAKPQVIKFNYLPPATSIAAGEADFFTFQAKQGQNLHLWLDLLDAGDANLFAWDPLNYGPPIWRATDIGDDQINIESVPLDGEYIVGVYGETDATYTLSHSLSRRMAKAAQSGAEANPDAYVPATRPIFIADALRLVSVDCSEQPTSPTFWIWSSYVLISPANSRLSGQGEVVEMEIKTENVTNLYGANLVVTFDPTLLQVRDLNANENGIQIHPGDFLDINNQFVVINRVDNQAGIIEFAVTQTYPADARNGDGVLASITFDSIGEGHSAISLTEARLVDNSTPDPQVIPVTMQNGSVLIGQQKLYLPMMMRP